MPLDPLIGTWELLSNDVEDRGSGARRPFFEAGAKGYLILAPDARMMALMVGRGRKAGQDERAQAALFRTMLAYAGTYRVEGNKFITTVDVSWNEAWNGTEQVRFYELTRDRLDIVTDWMANPLDPTQLGRAVLSWQRVKVAI